MPALVNIHKLEHDDVHLEGELTPQELELGGTDDLVHLRQPLHYDITAQKMERNILVQGTLSATLECECARCLKRFEQPLELPGWTALLELDGPEKVEIKDDSVDLTPWMREDILLEFPQHPLCENDCAGLPNRPEEQAGKGSPAWSALNKLKLK